MKSKKKITNLLTLGTYLILALLLTNCKDDFENQDLEKSKSPFSMKLISQDEIKQKNNIFKTITKFNSKIKSQNKSNIYNPQYNFTIDTDNAKYIETDDGSFNSYTFHIQRNENNGLLENLVFSLQPDGTYNSKIVSYNFIDENSVEIKYADLDLNSDDYLNKTVSISWSCTTTTTYSSTYDESCSCEFIYIIDVQTSCSFNYYEIADVSDGGGGGYSSGGGGGFGGGVWTGGGSPGNTPSTPISIGTSPLLMNYSKTIHNFLINNNFDENSPENVWVSQGSFFLNTFGQAIIAFPNSPETAISILHYLMQNDTLPYNGINFQEVFDYLNENNNSDEANSIAQEIIAISLSEDPAIDINQIMDAYIISTTFDECTHNLITRSFITKDFLEDTAFGEKIKNTFILNPSTHISFSPVTNQNNTTSAKTNYVRVTNPIDPVTGQQISGNVVTIEFNNDYLNQANDIAIITTIFHEILHAYIVELYYSGTLLSICPEYTELNDAFNAFVNDPNYPNTQYINQTIKDNLDNEMHDIYDDYIEDLAESIHNYAVKNNFKINNNVISLDYARNLIWGSLQNENVFQNCPTQIQASQTFNENVLNSPSNSDGTQTKSCN